jgi:uncharacterized protein (TIGR00251 family)
VIRVDEKDGGALFDVRVSPGARRTGALGEHAGALKVAVAAPPEKGRANAELIRFLSEILGVRKRCLRIVGGETSKSKRIAVEGPGASAVAAKISAVCDRS